MLLCARGLNSYTRRACQTVLAAHLLCLVGALAPVLPHLAEDAWQALPFPVAAPHGVPGESAGTVFEALWPKVDSRWGALPAEEVAMWGRLLQVELRFVTSPGFMGIEVW